MKRLSREAMEAFVKREWMKVNADGGKSRFYEHADLRGHTDAQVEALYREAAIMVSMGAEEWHDLKKMLLQGGIEACTKDALLYKNTDVNALRNLQTAVEVSYGKDEVERFLRDTGLKSIIGWYN